MTMLRSLYVVFFLVCISLAAFIAHFPEAAIQASSLRATVEVPFFSQTALRDQRISSGAPLHLGNDPSVPLWEYGCGVASLAMVFHHYGVDTDVVRLNEALRKEGAFSGALLAWDRRDAFLLAGRPWIQGIERVNTARPRDLRQRVDDELAANLPVIAFLGARHYVVLVGKDDRGGYLINDPWKLAAAQGQAIPLEKNDLNLKFDDIRQFIFIHPDRNAPTNAIAVSGSIADKYYSLGGSKGSLGNPAATVEMLAGGGRWQRFEHGAILAPPQGVFALYGPIWAKFQAEGGVAKMGLPRSDSYSYFVGSAVEWRADFADASIVWTEGEHNARLLTEANAIRAEYFANPNLTGALVYTRFEEDLLFDWRNGAPGPWVEPDGFSARYTATISVGGFGWWNNFVVDADDAVRIFIDGDNILDAWTDGATVHRFTHNLGRGEHTLVVEYSERQNEARLGVAWSAWPANPVFASEQTVGSFELLPASAAENAPDLSAAIVQATATAQTVIAAMTAEAAITPTPDAVVAAVAQQTFEAWAQGQREPYRDVQVATLDDDGYFATVQVTAWFRPDRDAPWEEREARIECRQVGNQWQCDDAFDFRLSDGEVARRQQAAMVAAEQRRAAAEQAAHNPLHPEWTSYANANIVLDLVVDGEAVWAATVGGIVRWDTSTGEYIKLTSEHGLAGNVANVIAVAPDGALWFGTDGGGVSRLGADGRWQTFTKVDGLADNNVFAIAIAPDGALWFGTKDGVSRLGADGHWQTFTTDDGLADDDVYAIAVAPDGALWFGTGGGGVSRLGTDGRWQTFDTTASWVVAIAVAPDGALWFGASNGGVSRLGADGRWQIFTTDDGLAHNSVIAIAAAPDGTLWFGTIGGGLSSLSTDGRWRTFTTDDGLADNSVIAIAVAPNGALWFGTDGGVSRLGTDLRWQTFTTADGLARDGVNAIAVAPDGALWFGTYSRGVSRLETDGRWQTFTTDDGLAHNRVNAIAVASDGALWFGTSGGVSRLGVDGRWRTFTTDDGLADNFVRAIAVVPNDALWFGTGGGVSRLGTDGRWRTFTTADGLAGDSIHVIAAAPDGAIWFGTYGGGVSRLDTDGRWQQFDATASWVVAIAVASDGAIWFGTVDGAGTLSSGVSRLGTDGSWQTFTTDDGLADNRVNAIAVAPDGALWFGTDGGVSRLGTDGSWRTFTTADGLAGNRVSAIAVAPDGALWFGAGGGVSHYRPLR